MIANDVSSKYTRRNSSEYQKICGYIKKIVDSHQGNYMVFFPSYSFMESVYNEMIQVEYAQYNESDFKIIKQNYSMNEKDREEFLLNFTQMSVTTNSIIGFCVIGGIFSEGIDLKNDRLIGSIIVGTGLPMICNERQILRKYFDENDKNGYDYAYVYPGMNKVLQAAGRVIRTDEDKGIIMLLDERFLNREYLKIFPREWDSFFSVNKNTISEVSKEFWNFV